VTSSESGSSSRASSSRAWARLVWEKIAEAMPLAEPDALGISSRTDSRRFCSARSLALRTASRDPSLDPSATSRVTDCSADTATRASIASAATRARERHSLLAAGVLEVVQRDEGPGHQRHQGDRGDGEGEL